MQSNNVTVVGLQWGDEGKGKIVDALAANSDMVSRYCGGANAGRGPRACAVDSESRHRQRQRRRPKCLSESVTAGHAE